jgi:MoaA/NifB/PqqE/SkfB family radical SAM enzyme
MKDEFTSTGAKFFSHQEAMNNLRNGRGQPVACHVAPTDICQHDCVFCSVSKRAADVLHPIQIFTYIDALVKRGLKAVILSGGGNPILYKSGDYDFNQLVDALKIRGLQIGLITNGMAMKDYGRRTSWQTVRPETLDKLTWIRISMSGLDHKEKEVYIPDIDKEKTTLGMSYVYYEESRDEWLKERIAYYAHTYQPRYVRLLPDCIDVCQIDPRGDKLQTWANQIDPDRVFVQRKPGKAPNVCYLGYIRPFLNADGYVYPCDSLVLQAGADRQFNKQWQICRWDEIDKLYDEPMKSLVDPAKLCPGCVFTTHNLILEEVRNGGATPPPLVEPEHVNFV